MRVNINGDVGIIRSEDAKQLNKALQGCGAQPGRLRRKKRGWRRRARGWRSE